LDEAIHHSGVKVGAGTPNCCQIWMGLSGEMGKQNALLLVECLQLTVTDWLVTLIGPRVVLTRFLNV
jgi:hypothetical protein